MKKSLEDIKTMGIKGNAHDDWAAMHECGNIICDESLPMEERIEAYTYLVHDLMGEIEEECNEEKVRYYTSL